MKSAKLLTYQTCFFFKFVHKNVCNQFSSHETTLNQTDTHLYESAPLSNGTTFKACLS